MTFIYVHGIFRPKVRQSKPNNEFHATSQKIQFRRSPFSKKRTNLTIDCLSVGLYAQGPQVLTYRPQILREARI